MAEEYLRELTQKYLENRCTEEETGIVLNYLETPAGQQYLSKLIDQDIEKSSLLKRPSSPVSSSEKTLAGIHQAMNQQDQAALRRKRYPWYWLTASVLLLLTAGLIYRLNYQKVEYRTAFGETRKIVLSDSTVVTLNANSVLTYLPDYKEKREVWLDGEAFFEVKHIEDTKSKEAGAVKFMVHTGQLSVEVTGTSFNINNRNEKTQVVLNTGSVRLKKERDPKADKDNEVTMLPGEMVEVYRNASIIKKTVNPVVYSSWKDNKLVCNDTPLKDIARVIHDTYGKEIRYENEELKNKVVTGTLPTNNLKLLTEVLSTSLKLKIDQKQDTIFIKNAQQ